MYEALSNPVDIQFGLYKELRTRHGKRNANESKKASLEGTRFNNDDHGKRIMDYDLRVYGTSGSLNRVGAYAHLAKALIECRFFQIYVVLDIIYRAFHPLKKTGARRGNLHLLSKEFLHRYTLGFNKCRRNVPRVALEGV